ncbi:MAG TPA: GNAT family N-acetyltransferase [Candidatus Limnocylindrales bacterium]|nr:GNAT family N-acetyltransferase [Candidatus Limnocylindrales bacterium]
MPPLEVAPYQRNDRSAVKELLRRSYHVHTHLDWYDVDDWLSESGSPVRVAYSGRQIAGVLGTSAPLNGAVWVRVAAVSDRHDAAAVLRTLWDDLLPELRALGAAQAAMLLLRDWPERVLPALGFAFLENIITLRRGDNNAPDEAEVPGCTLHLAREEDLPAIIAVDHAAFVPPWQMGAEELTLAERSSANSTIAVSETGLALGYQMSTLYFDGAHLARLAVHPQAQAHGVGHLLVSTMLRQFQRRGVYSVSVNTQESNTISQRLYTRLGFERNGYDLPVWVTAL